MIKYEKILATLVEISLKRRIFQKLTFDMFDAFQHHNWGWGIVDVCICVKKLN